MKKARILLTLIAVVGIMSGVLAYKVNARSKNIGITYYVTTIKGQPATVILIGITVISGTFYYYTTVNGAPAIAEARFSITI